MVEFRLDWSRFYLNFKNDWTAGRKSHRRWSTLLALLHRNTLSLSGSAGLSENSSKIFLFFRLLPLGCCVSRPSDLWEATFDPLFSCVLSGLKRSSDPARTTPNYLLVLLFDHPIPPNLYIVISLKHFDDQKEGKIDKKRDRPRVRTAYHEHPAYTVGNGCLESSFFFPFFFARFPSAFLFLAIYIVVKRAETNKRIFIYELLPCHDFFLLISLSLFFFSWTVQIRQSFFKAQVKVCLEPCSAGSCRLHSDDTIHPSPSLPSNCSLGPCGAVFVNRLFPSHPRQGGGERTQKKKNIIEKKDFFFFGFLKKKRRGKRRN